MIYHLLWRDIPRGPLWRRFLGIYREGRRPEGYIYSQKPPNTSRWYSNDIHRLDMVHMLYTMSKFNEVYSHFSFP